MQVKAKLNNLRISPRKVRLVADIVKGMDVDESLVVVANIVKRSSAHLEKLIKSAIANAENNFGMDRDNLYIFDIQVSEGYTLKRWMPRAYGRATTILKRSSKVFVILEERVEGKNRKSKKQLEEERESRIKEKTKRQKVVTEGSEKIKEEVKETEGEEKISAEHKKEHHDVEGKRKQSRESGWAKKIFRRKSD